MVFWPLESYWIRFSDNRTRGVFSLPSSYFFSAALSPVVSGFYRIQVASLGTPSVILLRKCHLPQEGELRSRVVGSLLRELSAQLTEEG